jgi:small-conductance mechanosensitive channel
MKEFLLQLETRLSDPVWNILVVVLSLLAGILIRMVLHWILAFYTKRSDFYLFKAVVRHLNTPANFLIPLLVLNSSVDLLRLSDESFVSKGIELCLLAAFAFTLIRCVTLVEDLIYQRNDITKADNLKERKIRTQIRFIAKFAIAIIVIVSIAAILLSFENLRKVGTGLLAGVGLGGIIIGFAAQSTLSNILAGFQIAFTQPIRIEDVVIAENEWGRVEDITLTYVVVRLWDERRLILPINYFIQKPFQNWTRVSSELLGTVFLYMDYSLPIDDVRKEFERLLAASNLWDGKVNVVQVTDCKERVIELRLLMSARNSSDAFDLRCYIRERIIGYIQQHHPASLPKTRSEAVLQRSDSPEQQALANAVPRT